MKCGATAVRRPRAWRRLLDRALTYANASMVPPLLRSRLLRARRGLLAEIEAGPEIRVPPGPVNALLSLVMRLEAAWLRRFDAPFGSSLLCLAQKPYPTHG